LAVYNVVRHVKRRDGGNSPPRAAVLPGAWRMLVWRRAKEFSTGSRKHERTKARNGKSRRACVAVSALEHLRCQAEKTDSVRLTSSNPSSRRFTQRTTPSPAEAVGKYSST